MSKLFVDKLDKFPSALESLQKRKGSNRAVPVKFVSGLFHGFSFGLCFRPILPTSRQMSRRKDKFQLFTKAWQTATKFFADADRIQIWDWI